MTIVQITLIFSIRSTFSFIPVIITCIMNVSNFLFVCSMVRRRADAGRYPSVANAAGCPTRGPPYDPDPRCVRHLTLNLRLFLFIYFFFLHKNNRCFFELVISFIDGSSCKYLSFVILSAFDNCLLKLAPLTSLICLTQNGSDQMKICCIIHPTELRN